MHLDAGTSVQADEAGGRDIIGDARLLLPGEGCVACVSGLADLEATLCRTNDHNLRAVRRFP